MGAIVPTYLFGDSSPFPDGYDFLAELRSFVQAASRALQLSHEADLLEQNLGERAQEHLHAIDALQSFFDGVTALVADRAARARAPQLVAPHARQILEHVERVAASAKQARAQHLDTESVDATTRIRERRTELRNVLAAYLLADPLPTLGWALSLSLGGTTPHGQVMLTHPGALTTCFMVDVTGDPRWSRPRKLGEIIQGVTLQVGYKKAFLRSSLHPDVHTLDELYISDLEIGPDSMELHLRRKPDAPRDAFILDLDIGLEGEPLGRVTRASDKGGESDAPFAPQGEHLDLLKEVADAIRRECQSLVARKTRLVFAQLDEHDVFERGLVRAVLERIAARLAPIAAQVNAHSPNPTELSLKFERDGGRREEIYLRKQELIDLVEPLPPEAQALFEGLAFMPKKRSIPPVPPRAI
ncbi:MAG: hypothetical protein KF901_08090 [Myxococcales bacterium]|nr:hypothetical protein [Myxococcales bacterium]